MCPFRAPTIQECVNSCWASRRFLFFPARFDDTVAFVSALVSLFLAEFVESETTKYEESILIWYFRKDQLHALSDDALLLLAMTCPATSSSTSILSIVVDLLLQNSVFFFLQISTSIIQRTNNIYYHETRITRFGKFMVTSPRR